VTTGNAAALRAVRLNTNKRRTYFIPNRSIR
jgi:hypothetical protein